jgi:glycosyltransferase involved in cell wall biosynthesis
MPDIDYGEQRTARGRRRVRSALRHATCIAAQSESMVDAAAAVGFAAVRIPLGVSLEDWPPVAPRPREPGRPARLIRVGSLSPVKDSELLIGTAVTLAAGGEDFVLDIAGEDQTGGRAATAAAESGLGDRIRFHGFLTQRQLRPLLLSADLMVQTSRHEAGPIAMLEAAVCGVPTVGTAVGHNAEWSPEAAVAAPGEPGALAAAIRALLRHDDRRLRVAELAGRRAIAEDADWTVARLTRLYRETSRP